MSQIGLWFVGTHQQDALDRGPITALDAAEMIARGQNAYHQTDEYKVFYTRTTIKTWQLQQEL